MIKNLVISNIPTREEDLNRVLYELTDHSWNNEAKSLWASESNGTIFYCESCDCYIWSSKHELPEDVTNLVFKEFHHIVSSRHEQ